MHTVVRVTRELVPHKTSNKYTHYIQFIKAHTVVRVTRELAHKRYRFANKLTICTGITQRDEYTAAPACESAYYTHRSKAHTEARVTGSLLKILKSFHFFFLVVCWEPCILPNFFCTVTSNQYIFLSFL